MIPDCRIRLTVSPDGIAGNKACQLFSNKPVGSCQTGQGSSAVNMPCMMVHPLLAFLHSSAVASIFSSLHFRSSSLLCKV